MQMPDYFDKKYDPADCKGSGVKKEGALFSCPLTLPAVGLRTKHETDNAEVMDFFSKLRYNGTSINKGGDSPCRIYSEKATSATPHSCAHFAG